MPFSQPVQEIIRTRYSCRTYYQQPLSADMQMRLAAFLSASTEGPFGTTPRFQLTAATDQDPRALKELGTYGFIKGAPAYVVSATRDGPGSLEDLGYLLERIVLYATDLGLGTCWLGGTFTQSSFAQRIEALPGELVPAVLSIGFPAKRPRIVDGIIRRSVGAHERQPWHKLFFDGDLSRPLDPESAGDYATPLEMLRLSPSASNRQPWRVVRMDNHWHFHIQRRRSGRARSSGGLRTFADLPRADIGIAMCHFELTARDIGLNGHWEFSQPAFPGSQEVEYAATWVA